MESHQRRWEDPPEPVLLFGPYCGSEHTVEMMLAGIRWCKRMRRRRAEIRHLERLLLVS